MDGTFYEELASVARFKELHYVIVVNNDIDESTIKVLFSLSITYGKVVLPCIAEVCNPAVAMTQMWEAGWPRRG